MLASPQRESLIQNGISFVRKALRNHMERKVNSELHRESEPPA